MPDDKIICYTLDLEHDYAGVAPGVSYEAFTNGQLLSRLRKIIERHELKLTVFATGKVLREREATVAFFESMGAEVELHGYHHIMDAPDFETEIQQGVEAYREYFGKNPIGYRSPGGLTSPSMMECLSDLGIRYDSSILPSFRLGVYNNLGSELTPHFHPELDLLELPIGVIPKIRIPIATSYIKLLGLSTYRILLSLFGKPTPITYLFHLVDVIPVPMRKKLSLFLRSAYWRGEGKGMDIFEASVQYFDRYGYKPEYMSNQYRRYADKLGPVPSDTRDRQQLAKREEATHGT